MAAETPTQKSFTIQKVYLTDKQFIESIAAANGCNNSEALHIVVNRYKTTENPSQKAEEIENLNKTIQDHQAKIESLQQTVDQYQEIIKQQRAEEENLLQQIQAAQIQPTEKVVEVEKQLIGSQFICELETPIATNARKLRKYIKQDFEITGTDAEYPNKLANTAIQFLINRKYSDLL
jgi:predicted RNase H-like nuclease (RuvC/YqgF family)